MILIPMPYKLWHLGSPELIMDYFVTGFPACV